MNPLLLRFIGIAVIALGLLTFGGYLGWTSCNDKWTARWEKQQREWQEQVNEANERARATEQRAAQAVNTLRDDHAARLHVLDADLARALGELRSAKARAALKPAATAPAACGSYAASPAQLSEQDAEFLVRFAAEADGVAIRLGTCQRYVSAVLGALAGNNQ